MPDIEAKEDTMEAWEILKALQYDQTLVDSFGARVRMRKCVVQVLSNKGWEDLNTNEEKGIFFDALLNVEFSR